MSKQREEAELFVEALTRLVGWAREHHLKMIDRCEACGHESDFISCSFEVRAGLVERKPGEIGTPGPA